MTQLRLDSRLEVVKYLDRNEWKTLRRTSTRLHTLTTPHVFRSIYTQPNVDSLNRAFSVAGTPSLACLEYTFCVQVYRYYKNANRILKHLETHHDMYGHHRDATVDFHLCFQHIPQLKDSEKLCKKINEAVELSRLCRQLPNLRNVRRSMQSEWETSISRSTLSHRRGLKMTVRRSYFGVQPLLAATKTRNFQSLTRNKSLRICRLMCGPANRTSCARSDDSRTNTLLSINIIPLDIHQAALYPTPTSSQSSQFSAHRYQELLW